MRQIDEEVLIVWVEAVKSEIGVLTIVAKVVQGSDYGSLK